MPPSPAPLQARWTSLYAHQLPALAKTKNPAQPHWPVQLDHCFARIILDSVIGGANPPPATPWTAKLKSPAIKTMSETQLERCIALGEDIKDGRANLVELDQQSLNVRGKTKSGSKRAMVDGEKVASPATKKAKASPEQDTQSNRTSTSKGKSQPTILTAMGFPAPPQSPPSSTAPLPPPAEIPDDLQALITASGLTVYRQRVLLLLCQIPSGCYSTYLALSNFLDSSPRAVGNALRNNPFAPRVPCHRVVAADGGIGGFHGEWGDAGKYCTDKVWLLNGEGVRVVEKKGKIAVEGRVWTGFV